LETFHSRLKRFVDNDVFEIPETLLNSVQGFMLPEIRVTADKGAWHLAFSGIHSVMQTVGEKIFNLRPLDATKFYLENFVDQEQPDLRFSEVSAELHEIRNIGSHRWFGKAMHFHVLNADQSEGWKHLGEILYLNPNVYHDAFQTGFQDKLWDFWSNYDDEENLFLRKYSFLKDFLALPKESPIAADIRALLKLTAGPDREQLETAIKAAIHEEYL